MKPQNYTLPLSILIVCLENPISNLQNPPLQMPHKQSHLPNALTPNEFLSPRVQQMPGDEMEIGRKVSYQFTTICYYHLNLSLLIISLLFAIYQFQ